MVAPLIVIVGPTASGKSKLALEIAQRYNGEIIAADSRTIYKGMDIGTAKPSPKEQAAVPHHMIDIIEPDITFTAASFQQLANEAIKDISDRGKLPIMVGGTGLYIDGVIFDFAFLPAVPPEEREQLQHLSIEQLQQKLHQQGIPLPENSHNSRHLIRALETNGAVPVKKSLRKNTLIIGVDIAKEELQKRIQARTNLMIQNGLKDEVRSLVKKYGWEAPGLSAVGYREWQTDEDLQTTAAAISHSTMQYAKRQRTWFKRNPHITWVNNSSDALALIQKFLQK